MSRKKTILDAPVSRKVLPCGKPVIETKSIDEKKIKALNALQELYPNLDKKYIKGLMEVSWLNSNKPEFLYKLQEAVDALLKSGISTSHYNNLSITSTKADFLQTEPDLYDKIKDILKREHNGQDLENVLLRINEATIEKNQENTRKELAKVISEMLEAQKEQQKIFDFIVASDSLEVIIDKLPQYEIVEISHEFRVKSQLEKITGIKGTIACRKCGCYEYHEHILQTRSWDEPSKVIRKCKNCSNVR